MTRDELVQMLFSVAQSGSGMTLTIEPIEVRLLLDSLQQIHISPSDSTARAIALCEARIETAEEQKDVARRMGLDMAFGCWSGVAACARSIADELMARRQ